MSVKQRRKVNPLRTRNGKLRLGPMSMVHLVDVRDNTAAPKRQKNKIQNRINVLLKRQRKGG